MASVRELPDGRKTIRFNVGGERCEISFGRIPKRLAESHAGHIEKLVSSLAGGFEADQEHYRWAGEQRPRVIMQLVKLELIPPQKPVEPIPESDPVPTLADWFSQYIENRPGSDGTKAVWNRAKNSAVKFFGKDRRIDAITTGEAMTWAESMQRGKKKFAEATARKTLAITRQVFRRAVKFKHITENPFQDEDLKTTVGHREKDYIDVPTIQQVLDVIPSAEWRAVVVFARFAGMRVQSELRLLRWSDIQWNANRFVVRSPKTKSVRRVPIFPEIKQALEDLLPITGDSEFVLGRRLKTKNNWGTPLMKMVVRAGIPSWSAVFNSLRASGEIDIARTYGLQCATEWVGNSVQVALKHYVRSTDADFERAANQASNLADKKTHNSTHTTAETDPKQPETANTTETRIALNPLKNAGKPAKNGVLASMPKTEKWPQQDLNL